MKLIKPILRFILPFIVLLLAACSVEITEVTPVSAPNPSAAAPVAATPVPWAELGLTGHLIFLKYEGDMRQSLVKLDLVSGALTTLFSPPTEGRLSNAAVSPDGTQIVLIYAPPAADRSGPGDTGLYLLLAGSDAPTALLLPRHNQEWFSTPAWSPDGNYIYYSHVVQQGDLDVSDYTLERLAYPVTGQPEVVLENALWPSFSPDGSNLAYLSFDPANFNQMLRVATADGANSRLLVPADTFTVIDSAFFSRDGQMIIFSAPNQLAAAQPSWLERLLGVGVASAHNVPSDWWRVPVTGGEPERLTRISGIGLFGAFDPAGNHIAFIDLFGVYVMNPDGSGILQLLNLTATGMLQWQP